MMKKVNPSRLALIIGTLALAFGFFAANAFAAEPGTVTMTVTAVGKKKHQPANRYQRQRAAFSEQGAHPGC